MKTRPLAEIRAAAEKPMPVRPRILRLLALLPMLWLTGCLEFEDQTLTYRYDARTDTLRIFQDYHGIFGADDTSKMTAEEEEQLTPRAYAEMMDPGSSDARLVADFRRQGGRITLTNDLVSFGLGAPSNAVSALTLPMAKKPYIPNAVDAVRKRTSIRDTFD